MTTSSFFKKNSLLKLAIPLIVGVVIGWYCQVSMLPISLLAVLSLFAMLFGISKFVPKWFFGVGASLFMLSVGIIVEECQEKAKYPQWDNEKHEYVAQLVEEPVVKGATVKALAEITLCDSLCCADARTSGLVYLFFPRSVEAELLRAGSRVSFKGNVSVYMNAGNPAEFDTERYYYIKGVSGYCYVRHDEWFYVDEGAISFLPLASRVRSHVVNLYKELAFEGDGLALLSALTIGERSDFPRELKEKYSAAGASHVLALSGMHLGVFYVLLVALFPLWSRKRHWIVVRETAIVSLIWVFAFVVGFSPSVVRAALLFTLISLGRCLQQDSSGVSSLSFAAIVMLIASPHLLFDVSFQLSFSAVLSILLLAPPLQRFFGLEGKNVVLRYIANLFILSFVAQVGTLPFVWYYFGVFPLYFLLTNIVVVPLAFVVMALSVLVWALIAIPFLQYPIVWLLKLVVSFMNGYVNTIASLPAASFALPSIDVSGAFLVVIFLLLLSFSLSKRALWLLLFSVCCIICSLSVLLFSSKNDFDTNYLIIYNNKKNPLLHAISVTGANYLISTVPQLDAEYEYVSSPFIKREALQQPQWVNGNFNNEELALNSGVLEYEGLEIRLVDDENWRENIYVQPADIVILCRGFLGKIEELVEAYPAACIVLDASLYKRSRQRILRECNALGIEPVDISSAGAMMLVASGNNFKLIPMRGK